MFRYVAGTLLVVGLVVVELLTVDLLTGLVSGLLRSVVFLSLLAEPVLSPVEIQQHPSTYHWGPLGQILRMSEKYKAWLLFHVDRA